MYFLTDRIHTLEEQLKDVETKADEKLVEEERKYKDLMVSFLI